VTRASLRVYAAVQRERYQHATRAEKHRLLDETVAVTGMHRKAAIRAAAAVEQKNGAIVRQLVGYDRFASKAAYAQLARVYQLARLHVNFFQPVQKLVSQTSSRGPGASPV
jgi:hypothetical protein